MTLVVCWLVFPLVLALVTLGCGLLVERAAGTLLPGALLPPLGLAAVIVVTNFVTLTDATAELATPIVVILAIAGLALSRKRARAFDGWAAVAAAVVFGFFAAPVVLSGEATFAGYTKLEDTASWFALIDYVMDHGQSLGEPPPSVYGFAVNTYLDTGYPMGSLLPLGAVRPLVGQDTAWVFQPYLAFLAATLALALYALLGRLVPSRPLRAAVSIVASQPAVLFSFSLWGGVKELAAISILALTVALLVPLLLAPAEQRRLVPVAVTSAALVGVLSLPAGVVWLAPLAVALFVVAIRERGSDFALRWGGAFVAITLALALPLLVKTGTFFDPARQTLTSGDLAALFHPLSPLQLFGIWPSGDFRASPDQLLVTDLLIAVLVAAGAFGLYWAWRRGVWELLLLLLTAGVGAALTAVLGSPWVDAKALAIASPAFLLAGLVGVVALVTGGRRVAAGLVAAAIVGGVLWSNAAAYREVDLAPRDRLAELERIGERTSGDGPTLLTEDEHYGLKHFLRDADPEGISESLRVRPAIGPAGGPVVTESQFFDIDRYGLNTTRAYRTIVRRRSPLASRPPAGFRMTSSDRHYEVWQRTQSTDPVLAHLPLGEGQIPSAKPRCPDVLGLARSARGRRIAVSERSPTAVLLLSRGAHPPGWETRPPSWETTGAGFGSLFPRGDGTVENQVRITEGGNHGVWIGGSFRGRLELTVDGRQIGARRHELNYMEGEYLLIGEVQLQPGTHRLTLRYGGADLHPGSAGYVMSAASIGVPLRKDYVGKSPWALGPLVLSRGVEQPRVTLVDPSRARSLCGKRLDWIEIVA